MMPGDRLICALVENKPVGAKFKQWPLHVTIVPWFRLDDSSDQIAAGLQKALITTRPSTVRTEGEVILGPLKNRPARLLEQPSTLDEIEVKVRNYLRQKRAWLVDETTKVHRPFRPHVTAQSNEALPANAELLCDRLYIVEQKGAGKEIVAEVKL